MENENPDKLMMEIVKHLRKYPFLLISIAGLSGITLLPLFKDPKQFGAVVWILAGASILPLVFQVIVETQKHHRTMQTLEADGSAGGRAARLSSAAVSSVVLSVFLIVGNAWETETANLDYVIGVLVISLVSGALAMIGWSGVRQSKVRGKGFALTGTVMSALLIMSSVGDMARAKFDGVQQVGGPQAFSGDSGINVQQGLNYARGGDYERAVTEFSIAIGKQPTTVALTNRAIAYMQLKQYRKCINDLNQAHEMNPRDPYVHYNMAAVSSATGDIEGALDYLDEALSCNFTDYDAIRKDADLAALRKSPELRKVLEKHKVFIRTE